MAADREPGSDPAAPVVRVESPIPVELGPRWRDGRPRVAVGQLHAMTSLCPGVYAETEGRIHLAKQREDFEALLDRHLTGLKERFRVQYHDIAPGPDLLVLPELLVPRTCLPELRAFSERTGSVVVAGLAFPDKGREYANECAVLVPGAEPVFYRKVTWSRHDCSWLKDPHELHRGDRLLRWQGRSSGWSFGVLVCYDFSRFDLVRQHNTEGRDQPLDLLIVVAYNPDARLYRSCCIADSHRYYKFVVMCNVADFGGSRIFGHVRAKGGRQVLAEAGKGSETLLVAELDLAGLKRARMTRNELLLGGHEERGSAKLDLPKDFLVKPASFEWREGGKMLTQGRLSYGVDDRGVYSDCRSRGKRLTLLGSRGLGDVRLGARSGALFAPPAGPISSWATPLSLLPRRETPDPPPRPLGKTRASSGPTATRRSEPRALGVYTSLEGVMISCRADHGTHSHIGFLHACTSRLSRASSRIRSGQVG